VNIPVQSEVVIDNYRIVLSLRIILSDSKHGTVYINLISNKTGYTGKDIYQ
jgi:hypothetical protein